MISTDYIVVNAIECPDGTVILSANRHDYRSHTQADGRTYAVDGGHDYLKRSAPDNDYTELSICYVDGKLKRTPNPK